MCGGLVSMKGTGVCGGTGECEGAGECVREW